MFCLFKFVVALCEFVLRVNFVLDLFVGCLLVLRLYFEVCLFWLFVACLLSLLLRLVVCCVC